MPTKLGRTTPRISDAVNRGVMTPAMKRLTSRDHECLAQVTEALSNQDFNTALKKINRITKKHSRLPDAYAYRGCIRFHLGNFRQGLTDYERCLSLDPNFLGPQTMKREEIQTEGSKTGKKKADTRKKNIPEATIEHKFHFKETIGEMYEVLKRTDVSLLQANHLSVSLRKMLDDRSVGNYGLIHVIFPKFQLPSISRLSEDKEALEVLFKVVANRKGMSQRQYKQGIDPTSEYAMAEIAPRNTHDLQSIDTWMDTQIMTLHGVSLTIRDLIKINADKYGAHAEIKTHNSRNLIHQVINAQRRSDVCRSIFKISDYILSFLVHSEGFKKFCSDNDFAFGQEIMEFYSKPGKEVNREYQYLDWKDDGNIKIKTNPPPNYKRRFLEVMSKAGNHRAMTRLAYFIIEDKGLSDIDAVREGLMLYEKAACLGNYWAQYQCGIIYFFGSQYNKDLEVDLFKAYLFCCAAIGKEDYNAYNKEFYELMPMIFNKAVNSPLLGRV